jgi:sugar phosphate isomerase/epimerase
LKIGLNLSFATKRWMIPEKLASMCKNDFNVKYIQFCWDLIDPWWPDEQRDVLAKRYKAAFQREGLEIKSTFGGLASYCYAHLLAPSAEQREVGFQYFKRAIDMTAAMGVDVVGTPVGGFSAEDAADPQRKEELYQQCLSYVRALAEYGKTNGIKEFHIEPSPVATEIPYNIETTVRLMHDLEGTTAIPVLLLIDWGHVLYKPLMKDEADILLWLKTLQPYIGSMHLQQTDGLMDRHWDFTHEGIVTPEYLRIVAESGLVDNVVQYLEVVTAFETPDQDVYAGMKITMEKLNGIFR